MTHTTSGLPVVIYCSSTNAFNLIFFNSIQNSYVHESSKLFENLQHLHIIKEKTLTSNHCLGFSVLKYIVLTFCWAYKRQQRLLSRFLGSLRAHNLQDLLQLIMHRGLWNMDHASCIILLWSNLNWNRCMCPQIPTKFLLVGFTGAFHSVTVSSVVK